MSARSPRGRKDTFSLEFNTHLQLFANQVSLLTCLHTGGKISTQENYQELLKFWDELQPYISLVAESEQKHIPEHTTLYNRQPINDILDDR